MPQRRHLPKDARLRAIGMLEAGMRQVVVARRLGVSPSVHSRLRTRLAQTNCTLDRRRSGRPRSTSQAQDRFLRTSALRSRSVSAEQLRERLSRTGTRVSVQTCGIDFTAMDLELGDLTLGCHFPRDIHKPG